MPKMHFIFSFKKFSPFMFASYIAVGSFPVPVLVHWFGVKSTNFVHRLEKKLNKNLFPTSEQIPLFLFTTCFKNYNKTA